MCQCVNVCVLYHTYYPHRVSKNRNFECNYISEGGPIDFFSHGLVGFFAGKVMHLDKKLHIILIISCILPDFDAISLLAGWEAVFTFHRGPTHTITFAVAASLVITGIYAAITLKKSVNPISKKEFLFVFILSLSGLFSHLFLDLITPWEMAIFWPFSHQKVVFDLTYFFDPVFFVVLFVSSCIVYFKQIKKSWVITAIVLVLLLTNFGVRYYEKGIARETVGTEDSDALVLPTIRFDTWWVVIIEKEYHIYQVNALQKKIVTQKTVDKPGVYTGSVKVPIDSAEEAVEYSKNNEKVKAFIEKSRLPAVTVDLNNGFWVIFWYDAFSVLDGEITTGMVATVGNDGSIDVQFSMYTNQNT
ncbi:MAG: metal-dependent hydrolase [Candidatus Methanofastidiosia archaeon]